MKRTDLPERFQELLSRIPYATIATVCPDGQPWNTPMVAHFDDDLNVYWLTNRFSRHCQNIEREPRIFVAVYDSQSPLGQGEGLYLQMRARVLDSAEEILAARARSALKFRENTPGHEDFLGNCPRRLIMASPEKAWFNTDSERDGHVIDTRQELFL